ncbi:RHS repeat-associated core domain-containing protein [Pseudomonas syringae]|uniref:RHS repeat-associated core domain-containing protein n=1 Tax=Pseudomonas syringae TaxID=317 RepID=UPI001F3705BF|nr:RHS repeat-associated core domain-containing protein [Pseudomonas syringae]
MHACASGERQKDHLSTELKRPEQFTFMRAEGRLLGIVHTNVSGPGSDLLAVDQSESVLHSIGLQQHRVFAYLPYGTCANERSTYLPGYTGQVPDPITGHYLLGNGRRAFNPVLMRFNRLDTLSPFGEGGLNAYAYCKGDPINYTDPTGHYSIPGMAGMASVRLRRRHSTGAIRSSLITEDGVVRTVDRALRRNTISSLPMSKSRRHIEDTVKNFDQNLPFIKKLASVNRNLASHCDTDLSLPHAKYYADLAVKVQAGQLSNTAAHVEAALKWASMVRARGGSSTPLVGLTFNMLGALASGTLDQHLYKTGRVLLQKNQSVRQVDRLHQ